MTVSPAEISKIMDELTKRLTAHIMGDGAETYSTAPAAESEPLTPSILQKMINALPPPQPPPVKLIEVDPYPIYGPARRHRRRRIHKKWLKRYGVKIVGYDYPMADNVLVDIKRGVGYCHPHVARSVRAMTRGEFY